MSEFIGSGRSSFPVTVEFHLSTRGQKDAILLGKSSAHHQKIMIEFPSDFIDEVEIDKQGNCSYYCKIINKNGKTTNAIFDKYPVSDDFLALIRQNRENNSLVKSYFDRVLSTPCEQFTFSENCFWAGDFSIDSYLGYFTRKNGEFLEFPDDDTKKAVAEKALDIMQNVVEKLDLEKIEFVLPSFEERNLEITSNFDRLSVRECSNELFYMFCGKRINMPASHKKFFQKFVDEYRLAFENDRLARIAANEKEIADKENAIFLLKKWAIENGSERLKLIIKNEIGFEKLAKEEWVQANFPGFCMLTNNEKWSTEDRFNPTLEELQELEKWKEAVKDKDFVKNIDLCYSTNRTRGYSVATIDIDLCLFGALEFGIWKEVGEREPE